MKRPRRVYLGPRKGQTQGWLEPSEHEDCEEALDPGAGGGAQRCRRRGGQGRLPAPRPGWSAGEAPGERARHGRLGADSSRRVRGG